MKDVVLFIRSAGRSSVDALQHVHDLGYEVAVAQKGYTNSLGLADHVIEADVNNVEELMLLVAEFNKKHRIAGVLTFGEFNVETTALIADYLGLPGLNVSSARICRNKFLTRVALEQEGIPSVKYCLLHGLENTTEPEKKLKYPFIIKPLNLAGSCAVIKITDKDEFQNAAGMLTDNRKNSPAADYMRDSLSDFWLAEEYIDGFEISVESITVDGETNVIAIHDKMLPINGPIFFEEYFVTQSGRITPELENRIIMLTKKILKAVKFNFGISHVEFRVTESGPILLEVNPRLGGVLIDSSVYYSTGINLLKSMVELSLGKKTCVEPLFKKPVAHTVLYPPKGVIKKVTGFEAASKVEGVKLVKQWVKEGQNVIVPQMEYGGAILVCSDTSEEAFEKVKFINSLIKFEAES